MRISKGTSPIPIPRTARVPGDIKRLSREVQQSIKALRDRAVVVHGGAKGAASTFQFKVRIFKDDDVWKATVHPGYVIVTNPSSSGDALSRAVPVIDSVPLDAEETPNLEVTADQWIYLRLQTDEKDQPTELPEIVADDAEKESTHYQPPPASVNGDYYYPIARIGSTGEGESLVLTVAEQYQQGGPLIHRPILPELENIIADEGENYEVFKERNTSGDKYLLRALTQLEGSGVPILKPHPRPEDAEPDHPGNPVDTIPVRRIRERATSPQVRVGKDSAAGDDFVQVEGNGYDFSTPGIISNLSVKDGLVDSVTRIDTGWTGKITHEFFTNITDTTPYLQLEQTFVDGILTGVKKQEPAGSLTAITGTTATPGNVFFATFAE